MLVLESVKTFQMLNFCHVSCSKQAHYLLSISSTSVGCNGGERNPLWLESVLSFLGQPTPFVTSTKGLRRLRGENLSGNCGGYVCLGITIQDRVGT